MTDKQCIHMNPLRTQLARQIPDIITATYIDYSSKLNIVLLCAHIIHLV